MRRINGDAVILTNFQPCGKAVAAVAFKARLGGFGGIAVGDGDTEQAGTDHGDTTNEEGTAFDALALCGRGFLHISCGFVSHYAAPSADFAAFAACPVAA